MLGGKQTFVMALHEQHPFVFFDCEPKQAIEDWNKDHPNDAKEELPIPTAPVQPPAKCSRQKECPEAPDSEPFCGITVEIAKAICKELNCTVKFHIASENPHHWESSEVAFKAIGAGQKAGEKHWADVAGGALHITADRSYLAQFTAPFYQTGYRMVTRRPAKTIDMWSFLAPFGADLWVMLIVEIVVVALFLFAFESPLTQSTWTGSDDGDSDIMDGRAAGLLDALYWSLTTFTTLVDKAPRTVGGKIVMFGHGFFMLIILASYTANLASFLTTSAVIPPFSGWETGDAPLAPDAMERARIAIPSNASQDIFVRHEQERWGKDFARLTRYERWEDAVTSVLCGANDVVFHDESMLLYYLNHEMVQFGAGELKSSVCDLADKSALGLPAGDARCGLMFAGPLFDSTGYGFAFGQDSTAFLAWTQAILKLQETKAIAKFFAAGGGFNFKVGSAGINMLATACSSDQGSSKFQAAEFFGLLLLTGIFVLLASAAQASGLIAKVRRRSRAVIPAMEGGPSPSQPDAMAAALRQALEATMPEAIERIVRQVATASGDGRGPIPSNETTDGGRVTSTGLHQQGM